jgi:hypothetical protein
LSQSEKNTEWAIEGISHQYVRESCPRGGVSTKWEIVSDGFGEKENKGNICWAQFLSIRATNISCQETVDGLPTYWYAP